MLRLAATLAALVPAFELERVTTGPSGGNQDTYTELVLSSADGERAIFATYEALTPDDVHSVFDFYERDGSTTRLLTRFGGSGPAFHENLFGASADARRIVFGGSGRWTADDTDNVEDVYAASGGVMERISLGNELDLAAIPVGMSGDGARVLFESAEHLTADDTDHRTMDIFLREGATTTRVSEGNGQFDTELVGHSADARVLVFRTAERVTPDDTDEYTDLYLRSATGIVKVTPGNGPFQTQFEGISDVGSAVVFTSQERLTADDADKRSDAYRWSGGAVRRVSTGPLGGNANDVAVGSVDNDSSVPKGRVLLIADDGGRVVFSTDERLTADDADPWTDSYVWSAAGVERVSTGPVGGNGPGEGFVVGGSRDGARLVFSSRERLTADDQDDRMDLFERADGVTRRLTTGPSGGNAAVDVTCFLEYCGGFAAASVDGRSVFFETRERLVGEDVDDAIDVYRRTGDETLLLSAARPGEASEDVAYVDGSDDGVIAYVQTEERLTADDLNARPDGYRVRAAVPPAPPTPTPTPTAQSSPPAAPQPPPGNPAAPRREAEGLRLLSRPRTVRLFRGTTRLARRGSGIRLTLPRAETLEVRVARLRANRPVPVGRVRLRARRGDQVLRLGTRLSRTVRLRPGHHRLTLVAGDGRPVRLVVRLVRR